MSEVTTQRKIIELDGNKSSTSEKTACQFGPREKRECKETGDEVGQPEL